MGKPSEIIGTKVFLKIKSALQKQSVVILVISVVMSETVLPEQEGGPGTWKSREFTVTSQEGSGSSPSELTLGGDAAHWLLDRPCQGT